MQYKVLVRRATIGDKQYFEGDIIDTPLNLSRAWPTRFKLIKGAPAEVAEVKPEAEVEPVEDAPVITEALPLGRDVTSEFEYALEAGVKVWKKGHKYIVSKTDTPDVAVNEDQMTKAETVAYIEAL